MTKGEIILAEIGVKALELLAIKPEFIGGKFDALFRQLVEQGFAGITERGYEITDPGCEYLVQHSPGNSVPNSKAPCGFARF